MTKRGNFHQLAFGASPAYKGANTSQNTTEVESNTEFTVRRVIRAAFRPRSDPLYQLQYSASQSITNPSTGNLRNNPPIIVTSVTPLKSNFNENLNLSPSNSIFLKILINWIQTTALREWGSRHKPPTTLAPSDKSPQRHQPPRQKPPLLLKMN